MNPVRSRMHVLATHRLWWLMFVGSAAGFAYLRSAVEGPWSLLLSLPLVVFAFMLLNERSRWKRDEARERATGIRRGPFD